MRATHVCSGGAQGNQRLATDAASRACAGLRDREQSCASRGAGIDRLVERPSQTGSGDYWLGAGGVRSWRATRRALFRIARVALPMVIEALETADTSDPTLKGSRTLLPLNCAGNLGGSIEKLP